MPSPSRSETKVPIDIVLGVEGLALYINDTRVYGPKPWGGGQYVHGFWVERKALIDVLKELDDD